MTITKKTNASSQALRLSLRLDAPIHAALQKQAQAENREIGEHILRILTRYAIDQQLLEPTIATDYELMWSLIQRAVEIALKLRQTCGSATDITLQTFKACMADKSWAADYETLVRDNPYKHGNPRKSPINKEIGFRIREAVNGKVVKLPNGRPAVTPVAGEIIQTYTPMHCPPAHL